MVNQAPKAPGTVAGNRPMPGSKSKPLSRKKDGVAKAGATPCPQRTRMRFSDSLHSMMGASPPGPFRCGSTICNMNPPATAASKALPPFSSTPMATCDASQCVDDTTPNVPCISGLVVNSDIGGSAADDEESISTLNNLNSLNCDKYITNWVYLG